MRIGREVLMINPETGCLEKTFDRLVAANKYLGLSYMDSRVGNACCVVGPQALVVTFGSTPSLYLRTPDQLWL